MCVGAQNESNSENVFTDEVNCILKSNEWIIYKLECAQLC